MVFQNLPQGVQAAGSDIPVTLSGCNPDYITEVHILKEGRSLGVKRFRGAERYVINVSCYLADTLDIEPYYSAGRIGFVEMPSWMGYFSVKATEYPASGNGPGEDARWLESAEVAYTAGTERCNPVVPLMEMDALLEICPGESVIIPIILDRQYSWSSLRAIPADGDVEFMSIISRQDDDTPRIYAYSVNTALMESTLEFTLDDTYRMEVTVGTTGSVEDFTRHIGIRHMESEGVRLCWVNKYGTVDFFTFSPVASTAISLDKTKVRGEQGVLLTAVEREETVTVQSPPLPPEDLVKLSGILSSPKVWQTTARGVILRRVDILTEKTRADFRRPGTLELSFRYL